MTACRLCLQGAPKGKWRKVETMVGAVQHQKPSTEIEALVSDVDSSIWLRLDYVALEL